MNVKEIVSHIPDYSCFMTVDELDASTFRLAEQYPDRVQVRCVGHSRQGHPIQLIQIGDKVQLVGRFQSRNYQKQLPDGTILNKVAYEVSVSRLSAMKEDPLTEALQSMNQRMPLQGQNTLSHAREY